MVYKHSAESKISVVDWVCYTCKTQNESTLNEGQSAAVCKKCGQVRTFDNDSTTALKNLRHSFKKQRHSFRKRRHYKKHLGRKKWVSSANDNKWVTEIKLRNGWLGIFNRQLAYRCPRCKMRILSDTDFLDLYDECPCCGEKFKLVGNANLRSTISSIQQKTKLKKERRQHRKQQFVNLLMFLPRKKEEFFYRIEKNKELIRKEKKKWNDEQIIIEKKRKAGQLASEKKREAEQIIIEKKRKAEQIARNKLTPQRPCSKCLDNKWTFISLNSNLTGATWKCIYCKKLELVTESEPREESTSRSGRKPIPQRVKDIVWNRDGAKCVECGSKENLEYDHIIPYSKGGSDTDRNLQLLCERCNRTKSNKIG